MRRLVSVAIALAVATVTGGRAEGQITLVPGPQIPVPSNTRYIAAADVDNDGFGDVLLDSNANNSVTISWGQPNALGMAATTRIAATGALRGLAGGDLNGDGHTDIAVINGTGNRVYTIYGHGNRTFNTPVPWGTDSPIGPTRGRGPYDVAIANFDRRRGNDIATVNRTSNSVSVLFNQGVGSETTRFSTIQIYPVGVNPERIKAADFNGDGNPDIVVLNTGGRGADSVSVLIADPNAPNDPFRNATPRSFGVGPGGRDLDVIDFNNDGALDIVVVNAQLAGAQTEFTVTVLLNRMVGGLPSGNFDAAPTVRLGCPTTIGGVEIACAPTGVAAGDFDKDGFADFAVSFSARHRTTGVIAIGFVSPYNGLGNGQFEPRDHVFVGRNPQGIVSLDSNFDGIPDVAVIELTDQSVRILAAEAPPPRGNGGPCNSGSQCVSGFCVDNACCATDSCPDGEVCSVPGTFGVCSPPAENGHPCTAPGQCVSGSCVDGFCCSTLSCPSGQFCNTGDCAPPSGNGTPCSDPNQCTSGNCVDAVCCESERCITGQSCNVPGSEGTCTAPLPNGSQCTVDSQCTSGFCTDGFCCTVDVCPVGQTCGATGVCIGQPVTATPTPSPTNTPTPQPNGASCGSGSQCVSTFCVDSVCCAQSSCPQGQACNITNSEGTCAPQRPIGGECSKDADCASGNCQNGTCQAARTPTPTATATHTQVPRPGPGSPCSTAANCDTGLFCTNGVCCISSGCLAPERCDILGFEGSCNPPLGEGGVCDRNSDCEAPLRCDIFGFEGECTEPLNVGEICDDASDCLPGLVCVFDPFVGEQVCQIPETPVPTVTPVPTEPVVQPGDIHVSRDGDCSIDRSRTRSAGWWLLAFPLILGMRRFRLRAIPVRGNRQ